MQSFQVKEYKSWYKIRFLINGQCHFLDLNDPNSTTKINKKHFKQCVYKKAFFNYKCYVDDESDIKGYISINIQNNILQLTTSQDNQTITSEFEITNKNNKKLIWMVLNIIDNIYFLLDVTCNYWNECQFHDNPQRRNLQEIYEMKIFTS